MNQNMPECQICKQIKAIVECPECGHQVCPDCYTENKCCQSSFSEDGRRVDDVIIFPPPVTSNIPAPESGSRRILVLKIVKCVLGAGLLILGIRGLTAFPFLINIFWANAPTTAGKLAVITALIIFILPTIIGGSLLIFSALRKPKAPMPTQASEVEI